MGLYVNPGNKMFQESLNSAIYVDKSGIIAYLNSVLETRQKFVCVSRPRRFGKTMTGDMLVAYYDCSVDSHGQFDGLAIQGDSSFEENINRYNVVHINAMDFFGPGVSIDDALCDLGQSLLDDLVAEFPDVAWPSKRLLDRCLATVYSQTSRAFVFVIDEWDCIFRVHKDDARAQTLYLDWLRGLLKDKPYIALAYATGILPIKKYGQHSALNMFTEISMTNAWPIAEYTGFTEAEVRSLCAQYERPFGELKRWYDGYTVNGVDIYNPRSVVMAVPSGIYDSYWTQTETFEALRAYIEMDFDGLRAKVVQLIGGERIPVNTAKFQNDMTSLSTADDVLTLLVHLGYLTYDLDERCVWIPNEEVAQEFMNCIEDRGWEEVMRSIRASDGLMQATLRGDAIAVAGAIEAAHRDNSSLLKYNDENALACVVSLAYYAARKTHLMRREMPAGKGFADIVFEPRPGVSLPGIVVELKRDCLAEDAIAQIRERDYACGLNAPEGVLLVGIAYDSKTKRHSCAIERC